MTLACVGFVGSSRSICAFHDNHDTYIIHSTHTYVFIVFSPVYLLSIFADEKTENIHTNGKVFFLHDLNHNYVNVLHDQCTERSCCSLCSSIPSHKYTHTHRNVILCTTEQCTILYDEFPVPPTIIRRTHGAKHMNEVN